MPFSGLDPWLNTLIVMSIAVVTAVAAAIAARIVVAGLARRHPALRAAYQRVRPRLDLLLLLIAVWIAGGMTAPAKQSWWPAISHAFLIACVITGAWLLAGLVSIGLERLTHRYTAVVGAQGRRMRTQLTVIKRLVIVIIAVLAMGAVLFSFPEVRAIGTSVLASAGIVSIIAGLAAQSTLGNLIAGIQLAFSDAIRVGDVVVVEDEWGTIGEITLSYVVVHVWDERRLVLPCTYFTTQPFESWTRRSDLILGTIEFDLDWRVPLEAFREEFNRVIDASELWDRRASSLVITDATGGHVRVRALISARNSDEQWSLRCLVREAMVEWVRREHPEALPVSRVELTATPAVRAEEASA
ncbi:mechanosensitive ion channel family protein [Ruicaihuangia caeni]|uniref:mechanosensitive ion channel family protein n=1 Tax=Ruicaihuangia caeni TaxID=3042517 RepID=UPI00338D9BAD